jgi:hypothetical protein
MAIVANQTSEFGDILYIKTDLAAVGLTSLIGFLDLTTNEDGTSYYEKKFQYSLNGITWSDWIVLNSTNIQAVPVKSTDTLFLRYRYKEIGNSNLSFSSNTVNGNYIAITNPQHFANSVFSQYFDINDIDVISWYLNVTEKMYASDLARYVSWEKEEDNIDDSVQLWQGISKLFSYYVILARKFKTFYQNENLLRSFLTQRGLFISTQESLGDMNNIMKNFNYEIARRGTINIKNFKDDGKLYNGELIRLLNISKKDEFIFDLFYNELCGWNIDNCSPLYRGLENHINANKLDLDMISKTSGVTQINSDYNSIFNITSTLNNGLNDSGDVTKLIPVSPHLDYILEFDVECLDNNTLINLGLNCYNLLNQIVNDTISIKDNISTNKFATNLNLNRFKTIGGFHRIKCIVYNNLKPSNFSQDSLNILAGNNLKFTTESVQFICPFILFSNGRVNIKNISLRRLSFYH